MTISVRATANPNMILGSSGYSFQCLDVVHEKVWIGRFDQGDMSYRDT
jgi:hypothetical protein